MRLGRTAHGAAGLGLAAATGKRQRQGVRRGKLQQPVEMCQVVAEELVELDHGARRIVVAQPPEPVRTLAQGQACRRGFAVGGVQPAAAHDQIVAALGGAQEIPGAVFLAVANPCG